MTDSPILKGAIEISKVLLWLFTTKIGLASLGAGILLLIVIRYAKALKERSLLLAAAGKKMGFGKACSALAEETVTLGAMAAANVPTLIAMAAVLSVVLALSGTVAKLDEFLGLQRKIKEYSLVLKNLEKRYKVARIECGGQSDEKTKLRISYYDQDGNVPPEGEETLEIEGSDIFIDALVVNFAYSGIESGDKINLAMPYRVFSEKVAQVDGLPLKIAKKGTTPFAYQRTEKEIYGMDKPTYDQRLGELLDIALDAESSRKAGIVRSFYGSAVHRVMKKGDAFIVWVEQSGGMTIKEEKAF
jgi:hypothetical protein